MSETEPESESDLHSADATELLSVETRDMAELEPYQDNPMEHEPEQLAALRESIRKFGFKNPLTISPDNEIVAGHGRLTAAQALIGDLESDIERHRDAGNDSIVTDLEHLNNGTIYVIVADELDATEQDEFRIADNKVFEHSNWDRDSLRFELREIGGAVGFGDEEVEDLLEVSRGEIDYDPGEIEEEKKRLEEKYKELAETKRNRKRGFDCPHCSKKLYLDAEQLRNALRRAHKED